MNTISFQNAGLIDIRAVRTFGVSAKECKNPIGFFGTGLKYAIAISLRLGCKVTLYRGLERFDFRTTEVAVRNSDFRIVTMNSEELGFTTDLGESTWGRAYEGRIYLNRRAFMTGTKVVTGTLIEEYLHLKHGYTDESREFQNFLLDSLVSMGELARGEPV